MSKKFRKEIDSIVNQFPKSELFELTSQLKRSASSFGDNISEGLARLTAKEIVNFSLMLIRVLYKPLTTLLAHYIYYMKKNEYLRLRMNKLSALHKAQFNRTV